MIPRSLAPQTLPGSRIPIVFHPGALDELGSLAKGMNAHRALVVSDPGIVEAGHVERAMRSLYQAGILARLFDGVAENPTTTHVARGLAIAKKFDIDLIIGLGGGSAMDCAKGINFLLTNGGEIKDYWGVNKAAKPMLPLIAIPTTAGTGSEAQSAALITDPDTHQKMACWDEKAAACLAILDPDLIATVPRAVAAATGIDAIAHAVETAGCTKRNDTSRSLSKRAWNLLTGAFVDSLDQKNKPGQDAPLDKMLLGAHLAGCAIENSMLGAAHACANPLTAKFNVTHGHAVGLLLPQVVRFNSADGQTPYADLEPNAETLADRLTTFLTAAGLPRTLAEANADPAAIGELAEMAAKQWTATFNPRKVGPAELAEIYRMASR